MVNNHILFYIDFSSEAYIIFHYVGEVNQLNYLSKILIIRAEEGRRELISLRSSCEPDT